MLKTQTTRRTFGKLALGAGAAAAAPLPVRAQAASRITVAQVSDVLTLDPTVDSSAIGINVFLNLYDQLTEIKADGSVGPLIAESWDSADEQKTWTFKIRNGVKFHDGTTMTIDDIIWTYKKIMADAKSPVRPYLTQVQSIEKLDGDRIQFKLASPFVTFDRQVTLVSIVPQKAYETLGAQQFSLTPVGSGPFKVKRWVKDSALELDAFTDYWGGKPKVDQVVVKPVPAEASRAAALISGELDIVPVLPPTLVDALANKPGVNIVKVKANRAVYGGVNVTNPLLSNVKLRQAINHAIDRDAIVTRLLRGAGVPLGQIAAPVLFGYDPNLKPPAYDVALAKKLVEESGYKGELIPFQYPNNRWAFADQVAQAVGNYLKAAGINVQLQPMEFSAFFPLWVGDKLQALYMFSLGITIMDADLILNLEYESGVSHGYWRSAEVDALAKQQRAEKDPEKRKQIMSRIWKLSQEAAPFFPLYSEIQAYGVRDGVTWQPRADERLKFRDASVKR